MSALKEWIVTLHKREDLESFYEDMETPGGLITIPDRRVQCRERRLISRNTHYMLTHEEAEQVKQDPRVWDVELAALVDITTRPQGYKIVQGDFDKSWTADADDINWGLLRHCEEDNRSNWGNAATSLVRDDLTITASGKNVDVVIVDGHIDPDHPEFAANSDGTGGTRVVQYNWFQHTNEVSGGSNGTYVYDRSGSYTNATDRDDNNHGCHCAGTVAGNTQGWARDANIYNISPYSTNPNSLSSSLMWDYIRAWHNSKAINTTTGRRNPTITNNSYGSILTVNENGFGTPKRVNYRGTDFNPGRDLTLAEMRERGFYAPGSTFSIPYYFTSRQADMQDAIDDGIIIVASAGNAYWKTVNATDQDYNNTFIMPFSGTDYTWYLHRGTGSGAGYAPVINVGATSNERDEEKAPFSNCGNQVDIYAAGEAIQSSLHSGGVTDARDSSYDLGKYQGTSMSGPQVAGVLAILAESWPNMKQTQAQQWLIDNASLDKMKDTETDNPMDLESLQGAPNRYLRWRNQRPATGTAFPRGNFGERYSTGVLWPRPKIQQTKYSAGGSFTPDFTITVTNSGASAYVMSGTDRNGSVSGNNPTLVFNNGDKVRFTMNASGHPFYIKTVQGTGSSNQASGATNQGAETGNIDWTIGSTGTFYYNCEFHGSMSNSITVS